MTTHPSTASKMPIIAVVTPATEEYDGIDSSHHDSSSAAAMVDATLRGVMLGAKFEKIATDSSAKAPSSVFESSPSTVFDFSVLNAAASLANVITASDAKMTPRRSQDPLIPTLKNFEFIPLQPSYSEEYEPFSELKAAAILDEGGSRSEDNGGEELEVLEAASILCMMSKARPSVDDVSLTMDMLRPTFKHVCYETESFQGYSTDGEEECHQDVRMLEETLPSKPIAVPRHPDRLAIPEDAEEVNRLHQYVRSDLLEIFVVPQVEEDDSDDEYAPKERYERVTRGSTYTGTMSVANRHYPGRVGFRCVHCANVRPTSAHATKSAFYPLRVHNLYRETCAWQRIHFKNCPFVPREVKERYDWLKQSDTSRGKVRYWEVSAMKIGLVNNPER